MEEVDLLLRAEGEFRSLLTLSSEPYLAFRLSETSWANIVRAPGDLDEDAIQGWPMLTVTSAHKVPSGWLDILKGIEAERWPSGFEPGVPNSSLFDFYPKEMQDFCRAERAQLRHLATEAFNLVRWRWSAYVDGSATYEPGGPMWSADGSEWHLLRFPITMTARLVPQLTLNARVAAGLESLIVAGFRSPVGREIWYLSRQMANEMDPATGIVLSVTAVEVELKRLLSEFAPDAAWLLVNLQAPPILKLIRDYLPTLEQFRAEFAPSKRLITVLNKAVELRNKFVHVGTSEDAQTWDGGLGDVEIDEVLNCASDLLWLFDIQRGHDWALEHLTEATAIELGLREPPSKPPHPRRFVVPRDSGT